MIYKIFCFNLKRYFFSRYVSMNQIKYYKKYSYILRKYKVKLATTDQLALFHFLQLYYDNNSNIYYLVKSYSQIARSTVTPVFAKCAVLLQQGIQFSEIIKESALFKKQLLIPILLSEQTNTFDTFIDQATKELEQHLETYKKYKQKMSYPIILLMLSLGIGLILDNSLIPQIKTLFINYQLKEPFLLKYFSIKLFFGALIILATIIGLLQFLCKKLFPSLFLSLPIFGKFHLMQMEKMLFMTWQIALQYNISVDRLFEIISQKQDDYTSYFFSTLNYGLKQGIPIYDLMYKVKVEPQYILLFQQQKSNKKMFALLEKFKKDIDQRQLKRVELFSQIISVGILLIISAIVLSIGLLLMTPINALIESI